MSIEALFDSRAEIWRPTETRGAGGQVVTTYTAIEQPVSGFNCAVMPPNLDVQNIGPGETTRAGRGGRVEIAMSRTLDVAERDVLRLVAGPQATSTWFVLSVARPRDHHIEAGIEPWVGELPEDES